MTSEARDPRDGRVERLYAIGSARWYEAFRAIWTRLTSRSAEIELDGRILKRATVANRVLDIGCGTGHNLARLHRLHVPFASYLGVDRTAAMLDIARESFRAETRATFVQADLHELAQSVEHYDLILCTWVASHLGRPRDAFEIAHGLLAPGGHALFLTLTRPRWYVAWWLTPFVRLFQARYVQPEAIRDLPGLQYRRTWTCGMTTLVELGSPEV